MTDSLKSLASTYFQISGASPNEAVFYGKDYGWSLTEDKILEGKVAFSLVLVSI